MSPLREVLLVGRAPGTAPVAREPIIGADREVPRPPMAQLSILQAQNRLSQAPSCPPLYAKSAPNIYNESSGRVNNSFRDSTNNSSCGTGARMTIQTHQPAYSTTSVYRPSENALDCSTSCIDSMDIDPTDREYQGNDSLLCEMTDLTEPREGEDSQQLFPPPPLDSIGSVVKQKKTTTVVNLLTPPVKEKENPTVSSSSGSRVESDDDGELCDSSLGLVLKSFKDVLAELELSKHPEKYRGKVQVKAKGNRCMCTCVPSISLLNLSIIQSFVFLFYITTLCWLTLSL